MPDTKPNLLITDIDGTLIRQSTFEQMIAYLVREGVWNMPPAIQAELEQIRRARQYRETSDGFDRELARWVRAVDESMVWRRLSEDVFRDACLHAAEQCAGRCYAFTRAVVVAARELRLYRTVALSQSPSVAIQRFAELEPHVFDYAYGTIYHAENGKLTGVRTLADKLTLTLGELTRLGEPGSFDCVAMGDTAADIPMLKQATHAIAFNPSDALLEEARRSRFGVVFERKNSILILHPDANACLREVHLHRILPRMMVYRVRQLLKERGFSIFPD
ncbi:MAG: haloacid dehalogenase-like hydrolase [Patescibacteria group bacterium]